MERKIDDIEWPKKEKTKQMCIKTCKRKKNPEAKYFVIQNENFEKQKTVLSKCTYQEISMKCLNIFEFNVCSKIMISLVLFKCQEAGFIFFREILLSYGKHKGHCTGCMKWTSKWAKSWLGWKCFASPFFLMVVRAVSRAPPRVGALIYKLSLWKWKGH